MRELNQSGWPQNNPRVSGPKMYDWSVNSDINEIEETLTPCTKTGIVTVHAIASTEVA